MQCIACSCRVLPDLAVGCMHAAGGGQRGAGQAVAGAAHRLPLEVRRSASFSFSLSHPCRSTLHACNPHTGMHPWAPKELVCACPGRGAALKGLLGFSCLKCMCVRKTGGSTRSPTARSCTRSSGAARSSSCPTAAWSRTLPEKELLQAALSWLVVLHVRLASLPAPALLQAEEDVLAVASTCLV